jgi:hypothetical protein
MSHIKYGFTGTRTGLNESQRNNIIKPLESNINKGNIIEVHHGDCVGADKDFHDICVDFGISQIIIHPPTDNKLRANCKSDFINKPKPYLDRNKDIVDQTDILIACPQTNIEEQRSGTWSTVRYARKFNKTILLF